MQRLGFVLTLGIFAIYLSACVAPELPSDKKATKLNFEPGADLTAEDDDGNGGGNVHGQKIDFLRDVKPIIDAHCTSCHFAGAKITNLELNSEEEYLQANLIVAGEPEQSYLLKRTIGYDGTNANMPLGGRDWDSKYYKILHEWVTQIQTPGQITLSANPRTIVADGQSTTTLTAVLLDTKGKPIQGKEVTFSGAQGDAGTFDSASNVFTNDQGQAFAILRSSTKAGTYNGLRVEFGNLSDSIAMTYTAGEASKITLVAAPNTILANGQSTSTLTAVVMDAHDNLVKNQKVIFSGDGGDAGTYTTAKEVDTNNLGQAQITLRSSIVAGEYSNYQANAGDVSDKTTVTFTQDANFVVTEVTLTATPSEIVADGQSTTILTATAKNANGDGVAGQSVIFSGASGNSGRYTTDTIVTTNNQGKANITLRSSTVKGFYDSYLATVGTINGGASVTFLAGPVAQITLIAIPDSIPADGQSTSTLTAVVKDAYGNLVTNKRVDFSGAGGDAGTYITNTTVNTDGSGQASVTLQSSTKSGIYRDYQANADTINKTTTVSFSSVDPFILANNIIKANCIGCHNQDSNIVNLDYDDQDSFIAAGVVVPGDPNASSLIMRTKFSGGNRANMPLNNNNFTQQEFATMKTWVEGMSGGNNSTNGNPFICLDDRQMDVTNVRRLSKEELKNISYQWLNYMDTNYTGGLSNAVSLIPEDQHEDFKNNDHRMSLQHIAAQYAIAASIADATVEYSCSRRKMFFAQDCACESNQIRINDGCFNDVAQTAALRIMRRPLDAAELQNYHNDYFNVDNGTNGSQDEKKKALKNLVARMIMNASTVYHLNMEGTDVNGKPGEFYLTPYALASRLTFHYWKAAPDDQMRDYINQGFLNHDAPQQQYQQVVDYVINQASGWNGQPGDVTKVSLQSYLTQLYGLFILQSFITVIGINILSINEIIPHIC